MKKPALYNVAGVTINTPHDATPAPDSYGFSTSMVRVRDRITISPEESASLRRSYLERIAAGLVSCSTKEERHEALLLETDRPNENTPLPLTTRSTTEELLWKSLYSLSQKQSTGQSRSLKSRKAPQCGKENQPGLL